MVFGNFIFASDNYENYSILAHITMERSDIYWIYGRKFHITWNLQH